MTKDIFIEASQSTTYDPTKNYMTNTQDQVPETWCCELVQPDHPALRTRSTINPFRGEADWEEREKEMLALMRDNLGMGLSSNQIGQNYNMFVMNHSHLGDIGVYNPIILETQGEISADEGCLTWPLLYITLKRPERIKVQYYKRDGSTKVETWMDGIDARCFLHEYDHLQGTVFIELASDLKLRRAKEKRDKRLKKFNRMIKRNTRGISFLGQ